MLDNRLNDIAQIAKIILRAKVRLQTALLDEMSRGSHDLVMQAIDDLEGTRKVLDCLFYSTQTDIENRKAIGE